MRDLEAGIVQSAIQLLQAYADRLATCGITWQGPEIEVWRSESERYTSEVRIWILKEGQIDDALEFHIYEDSQPVVTLEEATTWLREQIERIATSATMK